jgi:hypothetical protein
MEKEGCRSVPVPVHGSKDLGIGVNNHPNAPVNNHANGTT